MSFSVSPGVLISEVDITTTVSTGVSTSTGAFAGNFQWGPVNERTLIGSEVELVDNFGKPTSDTYQDFFSIANFLSYSSAAWVVRIGDANNQVNLNSTSGSSAIRIDNNEDYFVKSKPVGTGSWIARYPGAKGNSLAVAACDSSVSFNSNVTITGNTVGTWSSNFSIVPSTSLAASINGGQNDELHILVIDEDGAFSGTRGTILESYAHLSKAKGAKAADKLMNDFIDIKNWREIESKIREERNIVENEDIKHSNIFTKETILNFLQHGETKRVFWFDEYHQRGREDGLLIRVDNTYYLFSNRFDGQRTLGQFNPERYGYNYSWNLGSSNNGRCVDFPSIQEKMIYII